MNQTKPKTKKKVDRYLGIKHLGYRISQLPNPYSLNDLLKYAKFILAEKSGRLLKDPIWDEYTIEELLMEFFAHQFHTNKEFLTEFESANGLAFTQDSLEDFVAWADKQIAEEGKIKEKLLDESEEKVSFSPDDVLGED